MPEKKYICKDQDGNILDLIDKMSEEELSESPFLKNSLGVSRLLWILGYYLMVAGYLKGMFLSIAYF